MPGERMTARGVPYIDYLPDNADEAMAELPAMARRCAGCAFTPGTEAHGTPTTSRIAQECAAARCAFLCHMAADGMGHKTHLCAGWVEAIAAGRSALAAEAGHGG